MDHLYLAFKPTATSNESKIVLSCLIAEILFLSLNIMYANLSLSSDAFFLKNTKNIVVVVLQSFDLGNRTNTTKKKSFAIRIIEKCIDFLKRKINSKYLLIAVGLSTFTGMLDELV